MNNSTNERKGRWLGEIVNDMLQTEIPLIQLPSILIKGYDHVYDLKGKISMKTHDNLQVENEIKQAYFEFYQSK